MLALGLRNIVKKLSENSASVTLANQIRNFTEVMNEDCTDSDQPAVLTEADLQYPLVTRKTFIVLDHAIEIQ